MIKIIKSRFGNSSGLSKTVFKSAFHLIIVRVFSILVGLAIIPLSLAYIGKIQYGFWLIISSVVGWLAFFDLGISNGLRNKLSESIAKGNFSLAKQFVSTSYAFVTYISFAIVVLSIPLIFIFDLRSFLNVKDIENSIFTWSLIIVLVSFGLQFILNNLNSILFSYHKSDLVGLIGFLGQLLILVLLLIVKFFVKPNLIILIIIISYSPILVNILFSIFLYRSLLFNVKPSFRFINFENFKNIFNMSWAFFIVQTGAMILYQTDNIIISKLFGAQYVTDFNLIYKLFSFISMICFIFMTPYWSAYTEAWTKLDFKWMQKNLILIRRIWLIFLFMAVGLFFFVDFIVDIWVGNKVHISKSVSFAMMIYIISLTFQASHNYIINGIGKLKLQVYLMVFCILFNIPMSYYLGKTYGLEGVIYSNTAFSTLLGVSFYFQTNKLIFRKFICLKF
ncbi:hypothetical protein [uncultured Chryseobacterium sp.]|uniref:lipopolysaccharide biosynthesis protein n=1 Tax=uncultured Chryseobacterium sp. TaxID=259322 RepID=UPI0025FB2BE6|nr:hypothetical protein [uncultured Chryseobacterium sp.]